MRGVIHKSSKALKGTSLQITGPKALLFEVKSRGQLGLLLVYCHCWILMLN